MSSEGPERPAPAEDALPAVPEAPVSISVPPAPEEYSSSKGSSLPPPASLPSGEIPDPPDINWNDESALSRPGLKLLSVDQLPKASIIPASHRSKRPTSTKRRSLELALGAIGVVYGDIGTSPLYALRECFEHGLLVTQANVFGVLSLMFWSLTLIVSVKYLLYVLRADNRGEGGIMALATLASSAVKTPWRRVLVVALGIFGAALLYGDGAITPAISVLSAVEGMELAAPELHRSVLPITVVILVLLFSIQRRGTESVGRLFGPIMVVWFATLFVLGVWNLTLYPNMFGALSPHHAVGFVIDHGTQSSVVLGSVFLVVTGGEALYADLGHFGASPIRRAWFTLVWPALVINYLGQGARLLHDPESLENPFFRMAPAWALVPLIVLSTCATVIASQALISGVFSLTRQAAMLGFLPRVKILHTSAHEQGQIYVPFVNWCLMFATIALVLGFRSSSALAAAYGIAVTLTMVITTVLAFELVYLGWGWGALRAGGITALFLVPELMFLGANFTKVAAGGWFPLIIGAALFVVMTTWQRGRGILMKRFRQHTVPLKHFFRTLKKGTPHRVAGTAVFMTSLKDGTPPALLQNFKHNHVVHERILFVTVITSETARVNEEERTIVEDLGNGFQRVTAKYGFMENPDVPALLRRVGLLPDIESTTFFLGRETMIATDHPGMANWRVHLFSFLSRNSQPATKFFHIPPDRVMELGAQIEL